MSDEYTEVEVLSWGNRIGSSCLGVIFGIILFLGSFFVLYFNEGRIDYSQIASKAIEITANSPNPAEEGKLIATTGSVTSDETLGDNLFLKPGKYLALNRTVEMFAWEESSTTEKTKNVGGSETQTTTYSYNKEWTSSPEDSSFFKKPAGHENPPKSINDFSAKVTQAKIGIYSLDMQGIRLPSLQQFTPQLDNLIPDQNISLVGDYLFQGNGTLNSPQIGDLRIKYTILPNDFNGTVFGKLDTNNRIVAYHQGKTKLYLIAQGNKEDAVSQLKSEYTMWLWIFRGVGFLMMWFGLLLAAGPIAVILDFFPLLGDLVRGISGAFTIVVAFVLSSITILVSMLIYNPIALAIAATVTIVVFMALRKMFR